VLARYDGTCTVVSFDRSEWGRPNTATAPGIAAGDPLLRDAAWALGARGYRRAVEIVRERIAEGDVYVLNLTDRLSGHLCESLASADDPAAAAFEALCERAPADMAGFLGGVGGVSPWIASVSPERFVRVRRDAGRTGAARIAEVCPIKGTRPRGATPEADRFEALALAADDKERAEHVMVVDLERNDLGRVCDPGSIVVDPLYEVVATPYCHQMVSTVRGAMRDDATFAELLEAVFPCGSVTGAPKIAAMRIADSLEAEPRGAYCGALLVAVPGELDSSVLIRTLEGDAADPARATWGAGCGIVHDSDPASEWLELLLKASPVTGDGAPPVALRETMRVVRGRVPLLARHLARLASGGCGPSLLARVRAAVAEALEAADPGARYGRLGVTVGSDGEVAAELSARRSTLHVADGPLLIPAAVAEVPTLPPGAAKPADRAFWDEALGGVAAAGGDEVQAVLVAPDGTLIDGSTASVWLVREGELLTPPSPPAVAGVARELVFDAAAVLGIEAAEKPVTLYDLELADEVFFSNAVAGVVAARARGGRVSRLVGDAVARRMGFGADDEAVSS